MVCGLDSASQWSSSGDVVCQVAAHKKPPELGAGLSSSFPFDDGFSWDLFLCGGKPHAIFLLIWCGEDDHDGDDDDDEQGDSGVVLTSSSLFI